MSSSTDSSTKSLKQQLLSAHQKLENKKKLLAPLNAVLVIVAWLMVFIIIENLAYLPVEWKAATLFGLLIGAGVTLWMGNRNQISSKFIEFYRAFSAHSNLKELGYALDLEKNTVANPKLVEAAIFRNLELVDPEIFTRKLSEYVQSSEISATIRRRSLVVGLMLIASVATAYNFKEATFRYLAFYESFQKPNPFTFTVVPGDSTLEQGSPFVVSVEFSGSLLPDEVALYLKTPVEQDFRKRGMDSQGRTYSSSPIDLNTDISYFIEMDGFRSGIYMASVQLRPRLVDFAVSVVPPVYSGLDTTRFSYPFSQVQGLQGSELILSGNVNKPIKEFLVKNTEFEQDGLVENDLSFEYYARISTPDTIQFMLEDENGLTNLNPFRFVVNPVLDEYPVAEILEPLSSYEEIEPKHIDVLYRTSDDFGITRSALMYELRRAFVDEPITETIALENPRNGVLQNFLWDIQNLNLKPKDELHFWIETTDNDGYNGAKSSRSNVITLSVPSLIDYFDDINEQEDEVQTDLEEISESFEEMQEQYEMFKEQLREDPEVDYQDLRQIQEVQDKQEEIKERIDELNEKFEELKEELNESNLLSEETQEAYEELKQLMEEIDDPAFREALEQLQENLNSMTPEQLREAMENAEFNEELYKERIERTIELFKQLKLNADLEKLAQSYEDLARQEEEISSNQESNPEQQESLLEQTEQVEEQLQKLDENTTEKTERTVDELQESSKKELDEIKKELERRVEEQKNQKSGENSESESGSESQPNESSGSDQPQNLQQQYQKLAEMTRSAMSQMNQQQMNINIAGLQYILYSLINLSLEQEELTTYASAAESRSQAYVGYARDQKNVENIFKSLSDSLFQLSTEIPPFSNQINKEKLEVERLIEQSLVQMSERNQNRASVATRQALGGINKLSYLIANLLDQLQNQSNSGSGSGSGSMEQMIEQMQQMGQSQQQINQQIQDMINDMQGERLSQDQMERLNQLSRQQNAIRKQLQEMQRNGNLEGGDELGSELERMIEQMEETINDLRGGAVDPTLIERQQNILSRMLEAEDALQERDEEERREGTTGEEVNRVSPPEITLEELEQQIRNRLNDPNFTKYSPDYQRLIERYFELLKELQEKEIQ
jgi:hypothetical protein